MNDNKQNDQVDIVRLVDNEDNQNVNDGQGESGEEAEGGSSPDPSTDDNALDSAHEMGIGIDATEEKPKELNIAKDIDKAEEYLKDH